jgi:hypothetical protein
LYDFVIQSNKPNDETRWTMLQFPKWILDAAERFVSANRTTAQIDSRVNDDDIDNEGDAVVMVSERLRLDRRWREDLTLLQEFVSDQSLLPFLFELIERSKEQ